MSKLFLLKEDHHLEKTFDRNSFPMTSVTIKQVIKDWLDENIKNDYILDKAQIFQSRTRFGVPSIYILPLIIIDDEEAMLFKLTWE
jgi:hypothetical protein